MQYVTRKVSVGVACIVNKVKNPPLNELGQPIVTKNWKLEMGNLAAQRDWGYSKEYIEAMWMMLQQDKPDDFVIGTGETHSIEELCVAAFEHAGLDWHDHVTVNQAFVRPLETGPLCGDAAKAKRILGWQPNVRFKELVGIMVDADVAKYQ
jgi:GDPmannose 4,6-dehydratase